jgi:hypothetical protein
MRYQGVIFTLKDFSGPIIIKNSTFSNIKFKFNNCTIVRTAAEHDGNSIFNQGSVNQGKNLFYYSGNSDIEIIDNTFTECNGAIGMIYVVKTTDNSSLLIHHNTFSRISSLEGPTTIQIDILESASYYYDLELTTMP